MKYWNPILKWINKWIVTLPKKKQEPGPVYTKKTWKDFKPGDRFATVGNVTPGQFPPFRQIYSPVTKEDPRGKAFILDEYLAYHDQMVEQGVYEVFKVEETSFRGPFELKKVTHW